MSKDKKSKRPQSNKDSKKVSIKPHRRSSPDSSEKLDHYIRAAEVQYRPTKPPKTKGGNKEDE